MASDSPEQILGEAMAACGLTADWGKVRFSHVVGAQAESTDRRWRLTLRLMHDESLVVTASFMGLVSGYGDATGVGAARLLRSAIDRAADAVIAKCSYIHVDRKTMLRGILPTFKKAGVTKPQLRFLGDLLADRKRIGGGVHAIPGWPPREWAVANGYATVPATNRCFITNEGIDFLEKISASNLENVAREHRRSARGEKK